MEAIQGLETAEEKNVIGMHAMSRGRGPLAQ
jgi:hypothetical protein